MADLQKLKAEILADGIIDDHDVEIIRRELCTGRQIDKEGVEFLDSLRKEARSVCPAFEELFFKVVKRNVLTGGDIDAEKTDWLRQILYADGRIDEREAKFVLELRKDVAKTSPEFERLCEECKTGSVAGSIALAILIALMIESTRRFHCLDQIASPLFLLLVVISTVYWGKWPGLVTAVVLYLALEFFFIPPVYSIDLDWQDLPLAGLFVLTSLGVSALHKRRRPQESR